MDVGDLVTAIENNEEVLPECSDEIHPGQAGSDHCE